MAMRWQVERLQWEDEPLGTIELPKAPLHLTSGFGSGLARRAGDPPGVVWAIGDRGPNIKVKDAIKLYGAEGLEHLRHVKGAKLMPRLDIGPELVELRVGGGKVELLRALRIRDATGRPVSGLPLPPGPRLQSEPAFDLSGRPLTPDPGGLDTEGLAAKPEGGFWSGDEFAPSLVELDGEGRVVRRVVPEGIALDAPYPVEPRLPAIAARRQLNRGFEALALAGESLFIAFQSPLAHPDEAAHKGARHVRLWRLDARTAEVTAQYLYPLDKPESFRRDLERGKFAQDDVKVSEIAALPSGAMIVLERGSQTTKVYRIALKPEFELPSEHLDLATRPSVEELSCGEGFDLPVLAKTLLFSSDEAPDVGPDLEGMAILSPTELLLVSDNDFGVEGAKTGFWKLSFEEPVFG